MDRISPSKNDSFSFNNYSPNHSYFLKNLNSLNPLNQSHLRVSFPSSRLYSIKNKSLITQKYPKTNTENKLSILSTNLELTSSVNEQSYFSSKEPSIKLPFLQYHKKLKDSPGPCEKPNDIQVKTCSIAIGTDEELRSSSLKPIASRLNYMKQEESLNVFKIFKSSATPKVFNSKSYKRRKRLILV